MTAKVERADFDEPAFVAFLQAHLDDLAPTTPPESRHALDLDALRGNGIRVWVARDGDSIVGTVALAPLEPGHEELKSMRTDPARRGQGIATLVLQHALGDARHRGVERISLETGSGDFFGPAHALYAKHGFAECPPFGSYKPDPLSIFMTHRLLPTP